MHNNLDALQAMPPVSLRRGASDFHSVAKRASFYIAFGVHFQGFWKAKWLPKFGFRGFFLTLFFIAFEHPILVDSSRLRTRKIVISPRENHATFMFSIKICKLLDFAFVFGGENEENPFEIRIQKRVALKHRI